MTPETRQPLNKPFNYNIAILAMAVPIIVYLYFLQWKTGTAYGDDLYIFKEHEALHSFSEKISMPVSFGKYRPVHGLSIHFLIELFQKNINAYYAFNVSIQVINTFLFAFIVNLFLRSAFLSLFFGLAIGLSRFSYFNIAQLLNGGALEGLAMTFFLASLFFLVRALLIRDEYPPIRKQRDIISGILFANLAMYTHERYIVVLLFVVLLLLLYPGLMQLTKKQKAAIGAFAIFSIGLNVFLKKVIYGMAFFMGTGGQKIKFSFSEVFGFFTEAVLSIFQVNKGPEYLVGIKFTSLPFFDKMLVVILLIIFITAVVLFLKSSRNAFALKQIEERNRLWLFLALGALFVLLLVPAVLTIRLEQRWLQAPYAVFILMFVLITGVIPFTNGYTKNWAFSIFLILLLWVDFNYLNKGAGNIYMTNSENTVSKLEDAIHKDIIHPETERLFIWEKQRDANTESGITWELSEGYFFNFYQGHNKQLIFVDSIYRKNYPFAFCSIVNFNSKTDQVIYLENKITDLSGEYVKDSLKQFVATINNPAQGGSQFLRSQVIAATDIDKFTITGFYENENGIRWTNGNATIVFGADNEINDSLEIILNTYLPAVCKNINPTVFLTGDGDKKYDPVVSKKDGDRFGFVFYFPATVHVQKLNIVAEKINASPKDPRVLSFPFISLEIKR